MKVARFWTEKQKAKKANNEQNPGWKTLTKTITTKKMLENLHTQNISFSTQSLSAA